MTQAITAEELPVLEPDELEVSVVMPCLNEVRTVGRCVEKALQALRDLGVRGEVVVADNGSTDGSSDVAASYGARVVHAGRKGYGCALRAGIEATRGRYVVMGDADDSYDFLAIGPFIERLRAGGDLVVGNRFRGGIRPGAMPWSHRYVGNPVLSGLLNLFFHTPVRDAHCGLRAFRKESIVRLALGTTGMEYASEMIVKASLGRLNIVEVPTILHPDGRGRPPHLRSFRDGWRHLRLLLLLCPTWLYLIPSGALLFGGLSLMAWLTAGPRPFGSVVLDVHSLLLGVACVMLGYQTLWMWAFAKAIGWGHGHLSEDAFRGRFYANMSLEQGLLAGAAMVLTGLTLYFCLAWEWMGNDFGALEVRKTLRWALWGTMAIVLGVQTWSGSFLISLIRLGKEEDPSPVPSNSTQMADRRRTTGSR